MSHLRPRLKRSRRRLRREHRRGIFVVLAFFCLIGTIGFIALSVDLSVVSLTKTRLQNAADAAALAAAQEITAQIEAAGNAAGQSGNAGEEAADANSIAEDAARLMAAKVAELNGVFVDPENDVRFGKRVYNEAADNFSIVWGSKPFNVVGVTARRDNSDLEAPDGKLKLFFANVLGNESVALEASAVAFVEARDLVVVMDFSGSMSYDSQFRSDTLQKLGQPAIEDNLNKIWQDLGSPTWGNMGFTPNWVTVPSTKSSVRWQNTSVYVSASQNFSSVRLTFANGNTQTFSNQNKKTGTYQGSGSNNGQRITQTRVTISSTNEDTNFYNDATIIKGLGLTNVPYPYSSGSWAQYVQFAREHSSSGSSYYDATIGTVGYRYKFGVMTFLDFLMKHKAEFSKTNVLWKTRHYPFHAIKEGTTLLTDFLEGLEFGDHVGLVSYDTYHRVEQVLNDASIPEHVDISASPITDQYSKIDTIQRHKQASHYYNTTNIGGGLYRGTQLLRDHGRYGARPTIILMTDGNANVSDSGWSMPAGWNWADLTDYDDDGDADYSTNDTHMKYAFVRAKEAIDQGFTIHTLSVGATADRDMMKAIAFMGGGIWIDVPGGSTVEEMEEQMLAAFSKIAANVPPAKLLNDPDAE